MRVWILLCIALFACAGPGSPRASASEILALEQCLEIAIKNSTAVGISQEQHLRARNDVLQSYGGLLPNAQLQFYTGHTFLGPTKSIAIDSQGRPIQQSGSDYESYAFSLMSSMNVFDWGVTAKSISGSKQMAKAASYDLQYQKDYVTAVVIRAYYDYIRKMKLRDVRRMSTEAAAKNLEQVEAFYRIGSKTKADVLQAKVRLANTQLAMVTAANNKENARAYLASLLNFPLAKDFEIDASLEIRTVEPDLDAELEHMFAHRSDLLANHSRVQASQCALTANQNSRWPTIDASFRYSWNDRAFPEDANFFKQDYAWSVGVSLNFNLFDRFTTKANILSARTQQRIAEYQLQQARLNAILEVKQLVLALDEAGERISLSEETERQAEENMRLAEERYRVGAGTILETIDAEVSLTEARAAIIEAKCDYLIAKADLLRATGRRVTTQ
ncbi:MAG: TolC family protein [Chitinivibrionia bacterium]|nr:TolC family protein [Chitinivibrionia bacterium]